MIQITWERIKWLHRTFSKQNVTKHTRYRQQNLMNSPLALRDGTVQSEHTDVLFAGILLWLHEPSRPLDAHDKAAGDLRIQRPAVSRLLDSQYSLDPRNDLVRRRIRRLVKIYKPTPTTQHSSRLASPSLSDILCAYHIGITNGRRLAQFRQG